MLLIGDCLVRMAEMGQNSIDAIVTDPPYGLEFMGKEWDKFGGKPVGEGYDGNGGMKRYFKGNKPIYKWDMVAFQEFGYQWAVEALRVAKPGCHLLAFGGTRTFHRLACAIEDAGWEIRDTLMWVYGSGFPKSHDVSKAIDKAAGAYVPGPVSPNSRSAGPSPSGCYSEGVQTKTIPNPQTDAARQWSGWGTALKPAWEPIIMARKPLEGTVAANVQKWGTGAINVDGCRVGTDDSLQRTKSIDSPNDIFSSRYQRAQGYRPQWNRDSDEKMIVAGSPLGRWPANLIHDGSEEVLELFPDSNSTASNRGLRYSGKHGGLAGESCKYKQGTDGIRGHSDSGSAARFFYCAKASRAEREMGCEGIPAKPFQTNQPYGEGAEARAESNASGSRNHHPTVKPLALMRYLCRLVTPPGGLILDPFMGSGTTGMAAKAEGFEFIGIEKEKEYVEIAERRISAI